MFRKTTLIGVFGLFVLILVSLAVNRPQSALAQATKPKPKPEVIIGKTILEGMALDSERVPLYKYSNIVITIKDSDGEARVNSSWFPSDLGGLYRFELKPGVYDIFVSNNNPSAGKLRPLRINGVMLTGGKINKLDITLHKGEEIEVIGEPVDPALPAIIISEKFAEMQAQIDELKKQVAELKKK